MLAGGISWRFRVASLLRQCVIVTICGATIYCFHLIACAFFLLIVVMQQIFTRNGSISKRIWRTLLVLLPTALLVARYVFSSVRDPQFMSSPFSERFLGMMADLVMFTSVYFSSLQIINGILLSIALYLLIRYPVRRKYSEADNAFGCFSIALVMIYLCAPPSFGGGGYFNERIPQMLLLGLIPVVSGRQAVNDRRWLPHIIIGLAVTTFALNVYVYRQKSQLVEEYMSLLETPLTKRSIVMSYRPYGIEGSRVDVLMHAVSWYGLRHNLINAGNYEPRLSYFPVKLAPEIKKMIPDPDLVNYKPDKVDFAKYPGIVYLLLWINDKKYHQPGNFVPIATNGKLSLLRTHTD
jgi:isoprenylcysteine carboxyl methyltransferase (ICMT) family protein YpbQ